MTKRIFSTLVAVFMVCQVMMVGTVAAGTITLKPYKNSGSNSDTSIGYFWDGNIGELTIFEGANLGDFSIDGSVTSIVYCGNATVGDIYINVDSSFTLINQSGDNNATLTCGEIEIKEGSFTIEDRVNLVADTIANLNNSTSFNLTIEKGATVKAYEVLLINTTVTPKSVTINGVLRCTNLGVMSNYHFTLGNTGSVTVSTGAAVLVYGDINIPKNYFTGTAGVATMTVSKEITETEDMTLSFLTSNVEEVEKVFAEYEKNPSGDGSDIEKTLANYFFVGTISSANANNTYEDKDESPNYYTITVTTEGEGTVTSNTQEKSTYSIYQYTNRNFVFDGNVAAVYVDGKLVEDAEEGYYFTFVHDDHTLKVVFAEEAVEVGEIVVEVKANPSTGAVA